MSTIAEIQARRSGIARELLDIRSMRKGSINEQYFPVVEDGKKTGKKRGPYFVHTYKEGKKTVSARLKTGAALDQAREDADNYRRFRDLCAEFEQLTERLGRLEREGSASEEALKKGLKSRSSRTPR